MSSGVSGGTLQAVRPGALPERAIQAVRLGALSDSAGDVQGHPSAGDVPVQLSAGGRGHLNSRSHSYSRDIPNTSDEDENENEECE